MKRRAKLYSILMRGLLLLGLVSTSGASSEPRAETVAHEFLKLDVRQLAECDSEKAADLYRRSAAVLERFLEHAHARLLELGVGDWSNAQRGTALRALEIIDEALVEQAFVVCVKTDRLSQTFGELHPLSSPDTRVLRLNQRECEIEREPNRRQIAIDRHWKQGMRPIDCDLGSLLYLSVAERAGISLSMVRVPQHSFIRWRLRDGSYINWDTNSAGSWSDDEYRRKWLLSESVELRHGYLRDLKPAQVHAEYARVLVRKTKTTDPKCIVELFSAVEESVKADAAAANEFAWVFATHSGFEGSEYRTLGVNLAKRATSLQSDCNYWDTLSCSYASVGRFGEAISNEESNVAECSPRIEFFTQERTCYEPAVARAEACNCKPVE